MSAATIYLARLARELRAAGHESYARELVDALKPTLRCVGSEADTWDVADACYWFGCEHQGGQWSAGYALQCLVGRDYRPACRASGPEPEGLAANLHSCLVSEFEQGALR